MKKFIQQLGFFCQVIKKNYADFMLGIFIFCKDRKKRNVSKKAFLKPSLCAINQKTQEDSIKKVMMRLLLSTWL